MKYLKEYAKFFGGKQYNLAKELGISAPYLSSLLSGRRMPSLRLAIHIERKTGGEVPATAWYRVKENQKSLND